MQIRVALFITLSLCVLSGCQKRPKTYGNFARADSVELVQDAASALLANYPPAKTRLALAQETSDVFGSVLVETLRAHGYAVADNIERDKYLPAVKKPDGLAFAYIVDGREDELRVALHVGTETLSRMYRTQRAGDTLQYIPQGFWTRKQ